MEFNILNRKQCSQPLYLNIFNIVLIAGFWWSTVFTTGGKRVMRFLNDFLVVEISQDGHQETPVPVVCHTATIVAFSS